MFDGAAVVGGATGEETRFETGAGSLGLETVDDAAAAAALVGRGASDAMATAGVDGLDMNAGDAGSE
jgi:hypothetical protein